MATVLTVSSAVNPYKSLRWPPPNPALQCNHFDRDAHVPIQRVLPFVMGMTSKVSASLSKR